MTQQNDQEHPHGKLLPVSLYLKIFSLLLAMIFLNTGIAMLPLSSEVLIFILLFVAVAQTILVAVFFMELIHEDKFYSFIFLGTVLFMMLFFGITLLEIRGRNFFTPEEGVKMMRTIDQKGNFAPGGPHWDGEKKKE